MSLRAPGMRCTRAHRACVSFVPRKQNAKADFRMVMASRDFSVHRRTGRVSAAAAKSEAAYGGTQPESYGSVYLAVAVACCGAFSFGYHLGVLNGPLQQIATDLGIAANTSLQGFVVSISLAGAAIGSLAGSGLADSLGRKKAFLLDTLPLLAGSLLCATATTASAMLTGRALVGVGIGLASALVPLYISEVAPKNIRGALGSVNQLMICVGILAALVVNVVLPVTAWRTMFLCAVVPAGLLLLGMLLSPETPAYLMSKGQRADAESSARTLWGGGFKQELYGSLGSPTEGTSGQPDKPAAEDDVSWGEMLSGTNGKLVGIACMLFVIQQFSGINAIVYFSSSVFREAGLKSEALASAAVGVINVLGSLVAASLMDKQGRKQLLKLSFTGQGLSMLAMAAALALPALKAVAGPIALGGTLLYVLFFALGCGPVPGLLCAELLPISIRGRGVSLAMATHWVCNFMLGQLFLQAVAAFGVSGVYCFFASMCAFGVLFITNNVVETKGKTSEEIALLMSQ